LATTIVSLTTTSGSRLTKYTILLHGPLATRHRTVNLCPLRRAWVCEAVKIVVSNADDSYCERKSQDRRFQVPSRSRPRNDTFLTCFAQSCNGARIDLQISGGKAVSKYTFTASVSRRLYHGKNL
jgi:hypothetical protein